MPKIDGGWLVRAVAIGLIAGFLAGLFGVGGGIVAVPALVLLLGLTQHRAHATSMAAILATATAAAITAGAAGSVDWAVAAVLACGSVVGAYLGARLLDHISEIWLAIAFSILATISAVRLFIGSGDESTPVTAVDWSPRLVVSLVLVGLVAGTLAALLGVGGGIIYVPAMVLLLGLSQHVAQGSSLAADHPHRDRGDAHQPPCGEGRQARREWWWDWVGSPPALPEFDWRFASRVWCCSGCSPCCSCWSPSRCCSRWCAQPGSRPLRMRAERATGSPSPAARYKTIR